LTDATDVAKFDYGRALSAVRLTLTYTDEAKMNTNISAHPP